MTDAYAFLIIIGLGMAGLGLVLVNFFVLRRRMTVMRSDSGSAEYGLGLKQTRPTGRLESTDCTRVWKCGPGVSNLRMHGAAAVLARWADEE